MDQMAAKMAEGCVTSDAAGMPAILVPPFRNSHLAFRRRIVRLVMQKVLDQHDQGGRTIGYDGIEKVRKLIENGHTGQSTSSAGVLVTLERNQARFSSGDTHYQKDDAPDTYILEQQILHKRPENLRKNQFLLDKDKVGTVVLRHGTRDELFYPRGMQGSKKLFKCMQDLKIPAVKRKYWPLAADAEHIYWIGGMRGSRFGLPDEHTETFLLLTLRRKSR